VTNAPTCVQCGRPLVDQAYVCAPCTDAVRRGLLAVISLAGEAATTIARLDELGETGGPQEPPEPAERAAAALTPTALLVNLSAAGRHDAAVGELLGVARHVTEEAGHPLPMVERRTCRHRTCQSIRSGATAMPGPACEERRDHPAAVLAQWLVGRLEWLRHRPEAGELLSAIADACAEIERVVDRPAERWYAGPCGATTMDGLCPLELWPTAGARTVRCRCGAQHDLDDRKADLLVEAEERWMTAAACSHRLTMLGVRCTKDMVQGYARRGRLAPHPDPDPHGYPRYRLGSVRELVQEQQAAERERTILAAIRTAELAERRRQKAARKAAKEQEMMSA
jgi:hypothetical protein